MKNRMKRICASLLAALMVFAYMPAMAFADAEPDGWAPDHSYYMQGGTKYTATRTVQNATCEEPGSTTWTVDLDGVEPYVEPIEALGHQPGQTQRENVVPATCTEDGSHDDVVYCTRQGCGKELSRETVVDPAGNHAWNGGTVTTPATCTTDGVRTYRCTKCGETKTEAIPALGHDWHLDKVTKESTCTEDGEGLYKCSRCDETKTEVIKAGHTPKAEVVENEKEPTCTEPRTYESVVYCAVCGEELSRETLTSGRPNGHRWGGWTTTTEPTCSSEGVSTRTCSVCGATETRAIPKTAHGATEVVEFAIEPATCGSHGSPGRSKYVTYCTVCGEELSSEYGPAGEVQAVHNLDPASEKVITAPTCTMPGRTEYKCLTCGETVTVFVNPLGHTAGEPVKKKVVEATCTTEGSYDEVVYCEVCKAELSREFKNTAALGHAWEIKGTHAPTCTEGGNLGLICRHEGCGETPLVTVNNYLDYAEDLGLLPEELYAMVAPTGHNYVGKVTEEATCTEDGVMTYTCSACGDNYTKAIPAGHVYGESYEVTKEPTCTEDGVWIGYCDRCGTYVTDGVIPKLGHKFTQTSANITWNNVSATNATVHVVYGNYQTARKCSVCGQNEPFNWGDWQSYFNRQRTVDYTFSNHTSADYVFEYKVITEPTCNEPGEGRYTFQSEPLADGTRVGSTYRVSIPTIPHVQGAPVVENHVDATCTTAETYDEVVYCDVCGEELTRVKKTGEAAFGHKYGAPTEIERKDATCTEDGYYVLQRVCENDPSHVKKTTIEIKAEGHDWIYKFDPAGSVAATCVDGGYNAYKLVCTVCGADATKADVDGKLSAHTLRTLARASGIPISGDSPSGSFDLNTQTGVIKEMTKATGVHTPETVRENETATTYEKVVRCSVCGYEISRETVAQEDYTQAMEDAQAALEAAQEIDDTYPAENVEAVQAAAAELQALLDAGETDPAKIEEAVNKVNDAIAAAEIAKEAAEEEEEIIHGNAVALAKVALEEAAKINEADVSGEDYAIILEARKALHTAVEENLSTADIQAATKALEDAVAAAKANKAAVDKAYEGAAAITTENDYKDSSVKPVADAKAALDTAVKAGKNADIAKAVEDLNKAVASAAPKAENTLKVSGKTVKAKAKKAKKVSKAKAFKISGAQGKVTFKKVKGNKKITVAKNGKVSIKKGLKKGTYKVVVNVTAAGNGDYLKATKKVTFKVKVK